MPNLFEVDQIFFDLVNALVCIALLYFGLRGTQVSVRYKTILISTVFVPFVLNGVLFPPDLMSDQFKYLDSTLMWRSLAPLDEITQGFNYRITNSSLLFALTPTPSLENIRSLGFAAKFIFFLMVIVAARNYCFTNISLAFFCVFPSAILYSSLGLRDTQVLFFMFLSFLCMVRGHYFFAYIAAVPLFFIKFQNFYIHLVFITLYIAFKVRERGISMKKGILIFFTGYFVFLSIFPVFIDEINFYRVAMFIEDGGDIRDVNRITSTGDFLFRGLTDGMYFVLKPFPWEATNTLQLFQSVENLCLIIFLIYFSQLCLKKNPAKATFWLIYLIASCIIYGIVVANFGTAARYKFPIILTYVLFIGYECMQDTFGSRRRKSSGGGR